MKISISVYKPKLTTLYVSRKLLLTQIETMYMAYNERRV